MFKEPFRPFTEGLCNGKSAPQHAVTLVLSCVKLLGHGCMPLCIALHRAYFLASPCLTHLRMRSFRLAPGASGAGLKNCSSSVPCLFRVAWARDVGEGWAQPEQERELAPRCRHGTWCYGARGLMSAAVT